MSLVSPEVLLSVTRAPTTNISCSEYLRLTWQISVLTVMSPADHFAHGIRYLPPARPCSQFTPSMVGATSRPAVLSKIQKYKPKLPTPGEKLPSASAEVLRVSRLLAMPIGM